MGMCKKCKEVVATQELQAGYCKKCYTPELEAEDKRLAEERSKKRPTSITVVAILIIVMSLSTLIGAFGSDIAGIGVVDIVLTVGLIVGAAGLFQMKKWAAYLTLSILLLGVLVNFGAAIYVGSAGESVELFGAVMIVALVISIVKIIFSYVIYKHMDKMQQ